MTKKSTHRRMSASIVNDSESISDSDLKTIMRIALDDLTSRGIITSIRSLDNGKYPELEGQDVLLFLTDNGQKLFSGPDYREEYNEFKERHGFQYDQDTFLSHSGYINIKSLMNIPANASQPKQKQIRFMAEVTAGKIEAIYKKLREKSEDSEMPGAKVLDFEEGVQQIIQSIEGIKRRPILISVYGWPDQGKSELIEKRLEKHFIKQGYSVAANGSAPDEHRFRFIKDYSRADLFLFHCAWLRFSSPEYKEARGYEDPNCLAKEILGRDVDLNIAVHNPTLIPAKWADPRRESFLYDFILLNPKSVKKNP